jgi:predicted RNA binding protein YcfA (HicA-like mRNA interferase family)
MPSYKPEKVIKALKKLWRHKIRQKWSHVILYNKKLKRTIVVPLHRKDLTIWTFKSIIKQSWLTEDIIKKFL